MMGKKVEALGTVMVILSVVLVVAAYQNNNESLFLVFPPLFLTGFVVFLVGRFIN